MPKTLLEKVNYLLTIAKTKDFSRDDLKNIETLTSDDSDHPRLGKVFGYSVAEYAIETLKWINEEDIYKSFTKGLDEYKKGRITDLIESRCYQQI